MSLTRDRIVLLVHISELQRWLAAGWTAADGPAHPVQRAYGKVYIWREVSLLARLRAAFERCIRCM